jgi:hypothetical protein
MVDRGLDITLPYLHILEKSRPLGATDRTNRVTPERDSQKRGEAIPRCHPATKEKVLEGVPSRQQQHMEGRQVPEVWRRHSIWEGTTTRPCRWSHHHRS